MQARPEHSLTLNLRRMTNGTRLNQDHQSSHPVDDTRHFAETADHAIGVPRRHALGAGVDQGLEFRFETNFPGPSVIDEALNRDHLEHSITLWRYCSAREI